MTKLTINSVSHDSELDAISAELHVNDSSLAFACLHIEFASQRSSASLIIYDEAALHLLPVANTVILTADVIKALAEACDENTEIMLCPDLNAPLEVDLSDY